MQIEKLRLKGFIGIKRGLGLDEISIDFKNIVGLIAFAGQNGLGKSTVLENLHPFNTLASRSGALFTHVCVRDAQKLSDMTTGQLKTLFAEFLRLDRLQEYEETAKQVINVLTGKSGQIDINIEALGKRMEGVKDLRSEIERLISLKIEK